MRVLFDGVTTKKNLIGLNGVPYRDRRTNREREEILCPPALCHPYAGAEERTHIQRRRVGG